MKIDLNVIKKYLYYNIVCETNNSTAYFENKMNLV